MCGGGNPAELYLSHGARLLGAYRAEGSPGAAFLSCLCNQTISHIHNKPWPVAGAVPHSFIKAAEIFSTISTPARKCSARSPKSSHTFT